MGTQRSTDRTGSSPRTPLLQLAVLLLVTLPLAAQALDRDVVLEFLPPATGGANGYYVYALDEGTGAEEKFDAGLAVPDSDGIARTIVVLAEERSYRVSMTTYGEGGESVDSNVLQIPPVEVCDPVDCDDEDPCTLDGCGEDGACVYRLAPEGTTCDDGFVDTIDDQCDAGGVCEGLLLICSDDRGCDDGNVCNGAETCDGGLVCLEGVPLECDAPSACQISWCDAEAGCLVEDQPDGTACDDGDPDTENDACGAGVCRGEPVVADPPTGGGGGGGGEPVLAVTSCTPEIVGQGTTTLTIVGRGFVTGTEVHFDDGKGPTPKLRSLQLAGSDGTTMHAEIYVSGKGPKRDITWDMVITLPDGTAQRVQDAFTVRK